MVDYLYYSGQISIRAPRAGSDCSPSRTRQCRAYFNPRSPCGERPREMSMLSTLSAFQSALPVRGATNLHALAAFLHAVFQSALPVRGATHHDHPRHRRG